MKRVRPSDSLSIRVLYECANTCCVCKRPERPVQIHHIDGNRSNTIECNLVALCSLCHDKAHTKHYRSQNLNSKRLLEIKNRWNKEVAQISTKSMAQSIGLNSALWTYINHTRISVFMKQVSATFKEPLFRELRYRRLVDKFGVPQRTVKPSPDSHTWTVYDYLEFIDRHQVHHLLAGAVDNIISKTNPINVDAIWRRRDIGTLLKPGTICFTQRGFYFRGIARDKRERFERRRVIAQARKIRIELQISTLDMYGSSAIETTFKRHSQAACLFVVKSIEREFSWLVIHGTPIAMGSGSFARNSSPYYKWLQTIDRTNQRPQPEDEDLGPITHHTT